MSQRQRASAPPVMSFIGMFLSAKEVFGQEMPADFLRERVRTYGWKPSVTRLAQLAAYIQHPSRTLEEVLRRTVDPVLLITGDARAQPLIARAKTFIAAHRQRMRIAHEEVISYLQHLVLVEGGDGDDTPTDIELAFWMLGANCHLGEWAEGNSRALTIEEELIATQVRGHTFNQSRQWASLAVRTYDLFQACSEDESIGGRDAWQRMQEATFGAPFATYYKLFLAPLLATARRAGHDDRVPSVTIDYWKTTKVDPDWVKACLNAIGIRRSDASTAILAADNARDEEGLLHAPSLLRRKPLLIEDEGWLITSEAAMATLFHSGPWGAYLQQSKATYGDSTGFKKWSTAFGFALERYCANLARVASASPKFRGNWRLILPTSPGAADEIEDIIFVEDNHAVLFSIKSRLLPEDRIHRAKSQSQVIDWLDAFFFSEDRNFKGALRKLSGNIDEIRRGDFESQGVSRSVNVLPVLITYDEIGDDVFLNQRIRRKCRELGLLTQASVAPVTLGAVEEFEALMEYVAAGRSLVGLLRKRKHNMPWFDRRLDQQLGSLSPPINFEITRQRFEGLFGEVINALRASGLDH